MPKDTAFTDDDARELARLLGKYASSELDQFDHWIVEGKYGPAYVEIANDFPRDGRSASVYTTIWPLPSRLDSTPPSRSVWGVFEQADGRRVEVGRFANRDDATRFVVDQEQSVGHRRYWIAELAG